MADFFSQTERLAQRVGDGKLTGVFAVDGGPRSVPLEVGGWKTGPLAGVDIEHWTTAGTGPHAAQNSLEVTYDGSLRDIAETLLKEGPQAGMERHVERVQEQFEKRAPKRTGQYRQSTARFVMDGNTPVYEKFGEFYGQDPGE